MKNVPPYAAMAALAWLLSSVATPEEKIANAIKMLRMYKFESSEDPETAKLFKPPAPIQICRNSELG